MLFSGSAEKKLNPEKKLCLFGNVQFISFDFILVDAMIIHPFWLLISIKMKGLLFLKILRKFIIVYDFLKKKVISV